MSNPLYICDRGLSLATGTDPQDLLHAELSQLNLSAPDPDIHLQAADTLKHEPVLCRSPDAGSIKDFTLAALDQLEQLSHCCDAIWLLLPAPSQPSHTELQMNLQGRRLPENCQILLPQQLAASLQEGCEALRQGKQKRLTLLGLDSLTSLPVAQYYLNQKRLRSQHNPDGQVLGQGWAWFTLGTEPDPQRPAVIWHQAAIRQAAPAAADELPSGQVLAACMEAALQQPNQPLHQPQVWIHASRHTPEADLETFLAHRQLWSVHRTRFQQLQHLLPARVLGNLGAAALPMAISLACERLHFPLQPTEDLLLLDSQPDGTRLAIHLRQPETTPSSANSTEGTPS